MFRAAGAPAPTWGDAPALSPDDAVSRAVRAGFEVAEQAVRRGIGGVRAAAFGAGPGWSADAGPGPGPDDDDDHGDHVGADGDGSWGQAWTAGPYVDAVASAATRIIDTWASLLQQAVTVTGAAARSAVPARGAAWSGPWPAASSGSSGPSGLPPSQSPAPAPLRFGVEVRSRRAATVQLELTAAATAGIATYGLHAPPSLAAPALTAIELAVDDGAVTVRLEVPDTQPAGLYVGAVVSADGHPAGTLAVRLAE